MTNPACRRTVRLATDWAQRYATKCSSVEPMYSRFFAFISLFAFGMFTLVVSDNLLTLYVGWEIMGLCSYLLIGFWYAKPVGARRGRQSLPDHPPGRCVHAARPGGPVFGHRHAQLPRNLSQPGGAE